MTQSAFDFSAGRWQIAWPERISRYDLVFESPMEDPQHHGIPFGDGTLGGMVWTENSRLFVSLNRCDLWEEAKEARVINWKPAEEDRAGTLRHAARLVIDCRLPVFDREYLRHFEGRLSLADGVITVFAETLFGHFSFRCWIDRETHTLHGEISSALQGGVRPEVVLERFPSRTHSHWYAFLRRDAELGLSGTKPEVRDGIAFLSYTLSTGTFTCALGGVGLQKPGVLDPYRVGYTAGEKASFVLHVTAPMEKESVTSAAEVLDRARREESALFEKMCAWWKNFWLSSLMDGGEDYENALWHAWMYTLACSQGGPWPGRFINGLFGWNRDVQNWNYYFHWNQQELYWGLNAAGHSELCESYLDYRFRTVPWGQKDAKEHFGVENGIYVSDVCDWQGRNSSNEFYNRTPSAGIAMDFYRQYLYTGDEGFLREKAAPYMLGAARFIASLFHKEEDGKYRPRGGSCYENMRPIDESVTEIFSAKVLLPAAIRVAEKLGLSLPEKEQWQNMLAHMPEPYYIPATEKRLLRKNGAFILPEGPFAGRQIPGEETLSAGIYPAEMRPIEMDEPGRLPFHASWIAPAFPIGAVGLEDKGTRLYNALATNMLVRMPTHCGWDPLPVALARMGMAEEAEAELAGYASRWQRYDNGLGHYNPKTMETDTEDIWAEYPIAVLEGRGDPEEKILLNMAPFRHCGLEPCGVFTAAMNERLLQSREDGTIYIAPAVSAGASARFTLWAMGNVAVSSEIKNGKPLFIHLYAPMGGEWTVRNPFGEGDIKVSLSPSESRTLLPRGEKLPALVPETPEKNNACRRDPHSDARLGLPMRY